MAIIINAKKLLLSIREAHQTEEYSKKWVLRIKIKELFKINSSK